MCEGLLIYMDAGAGYHIYDLKILTDFLLLLK